MFRWVPAVVLAVTALALVLRAQQRTATRLKLVSVATMATVTATVNGSTVGDGEAGAPSERQHRLIVIGSSVAAGYGASGQRGWVHMVTPRLAPRLTVINLGEPGDNVISLIQRFRTAIKVLDPPVGPGDGVVVALSLANEGLSTTTNPAHISHICDLFVANILFLGMSIERLGATPIIAGVYPSNDYTAAHYVALRAVNDKFLKWGTDAEAELPDRTPYAHAINFLPAVDDGRGHWKLGFQADAIHPSDAGHTAMASAIDVPALTAVIAAAAAPLPTPPVRLLAVGDSLTAGFHKGGASLTPWAPDLARRLGVRVDYSAGSGMTAEQLAEGMDEEVQMDVVQECWTGVERLISSRHVRYTHVIIMAGTNDLGSGSTADEIFQNLALLHAKCHAMGISTVAISVPPSDFSDGIKAWAPLNAEIKGWAASTPKANYVEFPFEFSRKSGLWESDGLHMSDAGYLAFATQLAPLIKPLIA